MALRFGRSSISMEATDDGTAATLRYQGHNRARRCPGNTEELSTLWRTSDDGEKDNLFSVFDSNDGALYASSNSMATTLLYNPHGNRLLRAWRQPSTVRHSIIHCRIWGLGMPLRISEELGDVREANDAGDKQQTNGCIKPCCQALNRCPRAIVNSTEHRIPLRPSGDGEL